jgi:chorismate mutase
MDTTRLFAVRGATLCLNDARDIEMQVASLYDAMRTANNISETDTVSLIFSVTPDLTALNPAAALRRSGRGSELSLFCAAEPIVENSLPSVVRVIWHCYLPMDHILQHVYRNGAEILRPDRPNKNQNP